MTFKHQISHVAGLPAINFAAKRWHNASSVSLLGWTERESADFLLEFLDDAAEILQHAAFPIARRVRIIWHGGLLMNPVGANVKAALSNLIGGAGRLEYLELYLGKTPRLPLLGNLKHLLLTIDWDGRYHLSSLGEGGASFPKLETLSLCTIKERAPYRTSGSAGRQSSHPKLDLLGYSSLRSLRLVNVVPSRLDLLPGIEVHVTVKSLDNARGKVWQRPGLNLVSFEIEVSDADSVNDVAHSLSELPRLPQKVIICRAEFVVGYNMPVILDGLWSRVEDLCIRSGGLSNMVVPKDVAWKRFKVDAGRAQIVFEDVYGFVQQLPMVSVTCATLQDPFGLLKLAHEVEKLGQRAAWEVTRPLAHQSCCSGNDTALTCFFAYPTDGPHPSQISACCCGACAFCLRDVQETVLAEFPDWYNRPYAEPDYE